VLLLLVGSTPSDRYQDIQPHIKTAHSFPQRCLSLHVGGTLDSIIGNSSQVFLLMPAKAAGSSLKSFTYSCMNFTIPDNIVGRGIAFHREFFSQSLTLPKVIASHVRGDEHILHLIQHATQDTLMIFLYREETERLLSAISQVVRSECLRNSTHFQRIPELWLHDSPLNCTVSEAQLVSEVIEKKRYEINYSTLGALSCRFYDALDEHMPNFVILNFTQASKLQKLISDRYCKGADLRNGNREDEYTGRNIYVRINSGQDVPVKQWLNAKRNYLEWALSLKENVGCQRRTRKMEKTLFSCMDGALQMS